MDVLSHRLTFPSLPILAEPERGKLTDRQKLQITFQVNKEICDDISLHTAFLYTDLPTACVIKEVHSCEPQQRSQD
eukprot:1158796-Pelagomonas_calceolata.AAC.1